MRRLSIGVCLLSLTACDGVESLLGGEDAGEGLAALMGALSAQPSEALEKGESEFRLAGGDAVSVSSGCADGGTIAFEGSLDVQTPEPEEVDPDEFDPFDPDAGSPVDPGSLVPTIAFDYSVTFDGCTVDGVTIDGRFNWTFATQWDEDAEAVAYTWDYGGTVDFSGRVEGECAFSFGGGATGDADAAWTDARPVDFDGDACGHDANDVLGKDG